MACSKKVKRRRTEEWPDEFAPGKTRWMDLLFGPNELAVTDRIKPVSADT